MPPPGKLPWDYNLEVGHLVTQLAFYFKSEHYHPDLCMIQCACTCSTASVFLFVCVTSAETGNHAAQKSRQQELGEGGENCWYSRKPCDTLSTVTLLSLFLGLLRPLWVIRPWGAGLTVNDRQTVILHVLLSIFCRNVCGVLALYTLPSSAK